MGTEGISAAIIYPQMCWLRLLITEGNKNQAANNYTVVKTLGWIKMKDFFYVLHICILLPGNSKDRRLKKQHLTFTLPED